MIAGRRLAANAGRLLAGRIAAAGFLVMATIVLAARLGPAGLGGYGIIAATMFVANVATTYGTDMVLIREIAGAHRVDLWGAALTVQLALTAVAVAVSWAIAPMLPGQAVGTADGLRILALSLGPAAVFSVCSAALRGLGLMGRYAVLGTLVAGLQFVAVTLLVPPGASLQHVALVLVGVQAAAAVAAWLACARVSAAFRHVPRVRRDDLRAMLAGSGRVGALGVVGVAYQRVPIVAVGVLAGPAAAGWLTAASRVVDASRTGHLALYGALYPALAEEMSTSGRQASASGMPPSPLGTLASSSGSKLAWRLALSGAVGIAVALVAFGSLLMRLAFGGDFEPAAGGLAILALAVVPSSLVTFQLLELVAGHRERAALRALVVSSAVLLVTIAALVPRIGWAGGPWAVVAAESVQAAILLHSTGRLAQWRSRVGRRPAPAGLAQELR